MTAVAGIDTAAILGEIEKQEQVTTEVEEPQVKDVLCPHCGYNKTQDKVSISESDRREFFRCTMALRPFTKTFKLFGGDLTITMRALSNMDTDKLNKKIRSLQFDGSEMLELVTKLKILLACTTVNTLEHQIEVTIPEHLDDVDIAELFNSTFDMPETMLRLLSRVYMDFDQLIDQLNDEAFDEAFYKGGGIA
jgi:hypothetical protein